ncbi:MAG TPA: glutathione S-transferase family protein [Phenylobacterium sp.]
MIILYEHQLSPYAQKVKIAMREKGLNFEFAAPVGLGAGPILEGDFARISPRGEVPALVDGEVAIFDSTIILEYLEDKFPSPAMLPASAAERARVRMVEEVMDTHFEPIAWGLAELNWFRRAEGELAETLRASAKTQTEGFFAWLERELGEREWFNGEAFGWGDLSVVPYLNRSLGGAPPPARGLKLSAWLERANARPSVAMTIEEMAAPRLSMTDAASLVEKGLFKREYRDHRLEWMIKSGGLEVVVKGLEADNIRFSPTFE